MSSALLLVATAHGLLHAPLLRGAPLSTRAAVYSPPLRLLAGVPRRKASELKRILQAAGVSTAGIVEKEELERL
eukprot:7384757-Prymnesium_polylepis.1